MRFEFADGCYHLSHGMISLPEGKMKSREGTVVDADEIIDELTEMAKTEILSRQKISESEIENAAEKIAMAALKYFLLKLVASKDFIFHPEESVSLYGKTGPYLQYSYVRANRILQKIEKKPSLDVNFSLLNKQEEIALIRLLKDYPYALERASLSYSPHILAEHAHQLASSFNLFYEKYRVIGETDEEIQNSRHLLVECFREVMRNCLYMFGVNTVDVM
jgi:arginyl-tRNA synthetase